MYKSCALIAFAVLANLGTIYFMKLSDGLTSTWPIFGMLITNLLLLWTLGGVLARGVNVGIAMTTLNVGVMLGSLIIGAFFKERMSSYQAVGVSIAVLGVIVSNWGMFRSA
jgi:multidrug transporter EmrE-like cation transporter